MELGVAVAGLGIPVQKLRVLRHQESDQLRKSTSLSREIADFFSSTDSGFSGRQHERTDTSRSSQSTSLGHTTSTSQESQHHYDNFSVNSKGTREYLNFLKVDSVTHPSETQDLSSPTSDTEILHRRHSSKSDSGSYNKLHVFDLPDTPKRGMSMQLENSREKQFLSPTDGVDTESDTISIDHSVGSDANDTCELKQQKDGDSDVLQECVLEENTNTTDNNIEVEETPSKVNTHKDKEELHIYSEPHQDDDNDKNIEEEEFQIIDRTQDRSNSTHSTSIRRTITSLSSSIGTNSDLFGQSQRRQQKKSKPSGGTKRKRSGNLIMNTWVHNLLWSKLVWQQRYVSVQGGKVTIYNNKTDDNTVLTIPVSELASVAKAVEGVGGRMYCFKLVTKCTGSYFFQARSNDHRDDWYRVFELVISCQLKRETLLASRSKKSQKQQQQQQITASSFRQLDIAGVVADSETAAAKPNEKELEGPATENKKNLKKSKKSSTITRNPLLPR